MASSPHRIRRVRWQVRTGSAPEAFSVRKRLQEEWESVLPVFESLFNAAAGGDEVVRIPKLELRVTVGAGENLLEATAEAIARQLPAQLRPALRPEGPDRKGLSQKESAGEARIGIFRRYLFTGGLPWDAANAPAPEIASMLKESARASWPLLLEEIVRRNRPEVYFRLFQLLSLEETTAVIDRLSDRFPERWRVPLAGAARSLFRSGSAFFTRHAQLTLASSFVSEGIGRPAEMPDLSAAAGPFLLAEERDRLPLWAASLPPEIVPLFQASAGGERERPEGALFRPGSEPGTVMPEEIGRDRGAGADPLSDAVRSDPGGRIVPYAGLILLHPFLSRFLESVGVRAPESPIIPERRLPRAAALLYFLASGNETIYEFDLGLIKLLLGLDPETPLPVSEGLVGPADREEADLLLRTVIDYWSALKRTSADGLRASFLQRHGLLREEAHGWRLQVERTPFDLLIDRLPWGIGIVKLPWMKKALRTEW